jgi:D-inositol-3-phosphate glycosyltransferase
MLSVAMLSYHTCPLATLGGKDTGGMNVYVRDLTRHLGQLGVHVDVFTRSQDEHVPHVLHDLGYGNRVVHIPAGPESPRPRQELVRYIPQFADGIRAFAQEKGIHYDLIHSHYWMSGLAALNLKESWQVPVIQMFHTLVLMKNRVARSPEEIEGGYRLEGENEVLRQADRIVIATPAERSQLEFLYKADSRKLFIIPPGVDTSRFYPIPMDEAKAAIGVEPDQRILLFVGRIEPLKGLETLFRSIALLKTSGDIEICPYSLAIIGGDPNASDQELSDEMRRLKLLCRQLNIDDFVFFLGKCGQDTLPYYYAASDMVIVPSHYESFGMVALEAMACGKPVVASQVGGLAFLVQDGVTGYVVPDDDPAALAAKLRLLICQPEELQRLGARAAEYARGYDWQIIARRILSLYTQTVSKEPPPPITPAFPRREIV